MCVCVCVCVYVCSFSVSHLMPAFVVLLLGNVLCSVVFIAELIVNSMCKRRRKCIRALGE